MSSHITPVLKCFIPYITRSAYYIISFMVDNWTVSQDLTGVTVKEHTAYIPRLLNKPCVQKFCKLIQGQRYYLDFSSIFCQQYKLNNISI